MMLFHKDRRRCKSHFTTFSVLVFHLHLTLFCKGEYQLIGSSQPIIATLGDDIILPCLMRPAEDASGLTLEWTRPDLSPRFVYVWRSGQELEGKKHKYFEGRTSLFINELTLGNISLKLSEVKLADEGEYRCFIPALGRQSSIQLVVGSNVVSTPVITLTGIDKAIDVVDLQCKSTGWYPEPEVFWLDGEGNLLSAGPTETVRGPDGLYTVSSRVTVEKRHNNSFTCRVQQNSTNQIRETQIHVPDDFFECQSNPSIIVGLVVSLVVCILVILLLVFFVSRQNKIRQKPCSESNKTKYKFETEEDREREELMTGETVQMKEWSKGNSAKIRVEELHQRREESENKVKIFREQLETKKKEAEMKQAELQELHEETEKKEKNLQTVKEELENKNKESETSQTIRESLTMLIMGPSKEDKQKKEVENEVETLKKKLDTKTKEFEDKQAEVQQLQHEIHRMETNLQMANNMELERSQTPPVQSSSSRWPLVSRQAFREEQQKREDAENNVQILEQKLQMKIWELVGSQADTIMQLLQERQQRQKAQREVDTLKNQSNSNINEVDKLLADVEKLIKEKLNLQMELEKKKKQLEDKAETVNMKWKQTNKELKEANHQLKSKDEEISQLKRQLEKQLWEEEKKKKAMKADKELEEQKRKNTENASKCVGEVSGSSQRDGFNLHSLSSTTEPVILIEVNQSGKYVRFKNTCNEVQQLQGWKVLIQVNSEEPIIYTFDHLSKLSPGETFTMKVPGYNFYPLTDLLWTDLKSWSSEDKLQVVLISITEEFDTTHS